MKSLIGLTITRSIMRGDDHRQRVFHKESRPIVIMIGRLSL
ncbi:hypothetical protein HMPREF9103_01555 [Lentilactobacillus parafarraginis F0439]|uniref:Uncharacterized protein n=1 Tax=Lentilactobacillus parafarraginis F0439 TaxID=797515 RepID=G9ZPA1_9LACO|nr:hypothetical protein HMPREF9103_01555 [Lentilactobacillus parafarraginis F0439]